VPSSLAVAATILEKDKSKKEELRGREMILDDRDGIE
jgi:hypothetical protein